MNFKAINNIYLIGIGGIGMSALARYFIAQGKYVAGYDLNPTEITSHLQNEGAVISFTESISYIPAKIKNEKDATLVIYTPAINPRNCIMYYFSKHKFVIRKRAEVLGIITSRGKNIAIAGTHGKTTVTTMTSHILWKAGIIECAFIGGISKNYNTNMLLSYPDQAPNRFIIEEADEFDKSFLNLKPDIAAITSIDPDHLDIYKKSDEVYKAFEEFAKRIRPEGSLVINKDLIINTPEDIKKYTFSLTDEADFYAQNIRLEKQFYKADIVTPSHVIKNLAIGMPGIINVKNAVCSTAVAQIAGVSEDIIRDAFYTFSGIKRRFDIQINTDKIVLIDDYAHHPEEIRAFIDAVRQMFKNKKITGVFQPHLYTRTRDFAAEFAHSLDLLDEVILTEIYPAREEPLEGVGPEIIYDKITQADKTLCKKSDLIDLISGIDIDVLLVMGAGNIENEVPKIKEILEKRIEKI